MLLTAATLAGPNLRGFNNGSNASVRIVVLGLAKMLFLLMSNMPFVRASPIVRQLPRALTENEQPPLDNADMWVYLGTAVALVLLGGAFAGLTIALMGQDEIYLQVIASSGDGSERRNARKVLNLLRKGKHWVLVTLLLANVITNETLPIVLDRSIGGGWPAVLSSTVLVVIFGEIAPQSVCVRYGLPIGAWMAPFVFCLMWLLAPVAWPTAKLLDKLLGEDHGTTYKKAGLKTLVTLHKTLGRSPDERLNEDEVTIISAVLDLKEKPVGSIMTPMNDVFTLSADAVLDENLMDTILLAGYSRIPIYAPKNPNNFLGMLLVKMLITYDPEDCLRVRDFSLATLPETRPETSCLDIVNFFQEGKSHMVLVSDYPGEPYGALGVVTLEDVIEELIGEEIIDESDVFIDVHKAIRRMQPAPWYRVPKGEVVTDGPPAKIHARQDSKERPETTEAEVTGSKKVSLADLATSPRATTFLMRRRSGGTGSPINQTVPVTFRSNTAEIKQHLKHLGPSNAASRPKSTRIGTVKIKPGVGIIPENTSSVPEDVEAPSVATDSVLIPTAKQPLLPPAGRAASDAVQAIVQGYGSLDSNASTQREVPDLNRQQEQGQQQINDTSDLKILGSERQQTSSPITGTYQRGDKLVIGSQPQSGPATPRDNSPAHSIVGPLHSKSPSPTSRRHVTVRSGSITESFVDLGGVKKMVLEPTSSSDDIDEPEGHASQGRTEDERHDEPAAKGKKKQRKKRAGKKKKAKSEGKAEGTGEETEPLLKNH